MRTKGRPDSIAASSRGHRPAAGRPAAVLLDSFGTLVSMESPAYRLAATWGIPLEVAEPAFRAEIEYYLEHHVEGRDQESLSDLRDRCARVLAEQLGEWTPGDARAAMLGAIRFHAFPDAAPALREMRARGLRLVVASNWDCSLPQVLEEAGLADLVDGVVASAVVGFDKPAPELFEAALEVAGCEASDAVHVGDSPSADVAGAAAVGIRPVLLQRDGTQPGNATATIATLAALPGLL